VNARWAKVSAGGLPEAYTRQVMVRLYLDRTRRAWFRREASTPDVPDQAQDDDRNGLDDVAAAVHAGLDGLPPRQRAVLVLRYWEDLTLQEVATTLGCSVGTAKSHASRGLATLRSRLSPQEGPAEVQGLSGKEEDVTDDDTFMKDVLARAVQERPAPVLDVETVIAGGSRRRRRRTGLTILGTVSGSVLAAGVVLGVTARDHTPTVGWSKPHRWTRYCCPHILEAHRPLCRHCPNVDQFDHWELRTRKGRGGSTSSARSWASSVRAPTGCCGRWLSPVSRRGRCGVRTTTA
jgi:Sigma-70, region 4